MLSVEQIAEELKAYGQANNLYGLEGRLQRGLDPAGLLAVREIRERIELILYKLGVDIEEAEELTIRLHTKGPWDDVAELSKGQDAAVCAWIVIGEISIRGREKESDMTEQEFFNDLARIDALIDQALNDPELYLEQAKQALINQCHEQIVVVDGVPTSTFDDGPLSAAILGYNYCVVKGDQGLTFCGAKVLDYSVLKDHGLKAVELEDRGRMSTFFVNDAGDRVVKKLYDGFAIVFDEFDTSGQIAIDLAKTGQTLALKNPLTLS